MGRTVAVFDWDGVVIDSSVAHERSWEALAKEEGLPLPADHFKRGFGKRNELIIPDILGWAREPTEVKRLSNRKEALYRDIARTGHVRLLPGVRELCGALRDLGIPCVIGTSTHKENLALSFELFGIGHFFAGAVASEDVTRGKPDPEVFLKACALGGGEPATSFVFEDSFSGLQAGLAGGFVTIALATTNTRAQLAPVGAHRIVADLSEVDPGWLARGRLS
ncbi:beta-phosphoglucomutase [Opitutia bacterium]|jgi:HAD superfamily hydrolase (TIGR01509 family)|nr:beta-phosphoglucomutase [Opitutae bacterium]